MKRGIHERWGAPLAVALVLGALPLGCARRQPPPLLPPPAVTVAHALRQTVVEWDEYTGRLAAVDSVDVRARVSGLITAAPFQEGVVVNAGATLFEIDARPFQADLDSKLADIQKYQAQVALDQLQHDMLSEQFKNNAASQFEVDSARATLRQAQAAIEGAKAAAGASRLNVDWCHVTAPVTGRISRKYVTVGNLISGGTPQAALLTTIVSIDPIYCYFDVDEASILKYSRLLRERKLVNIYQARVPCYMEVGDETGFPHEGTIDFADNRVDPATGTKQARGVFPNSGGWLQAGFSARVRVRGSEPYEALLVPDAAIGTNQNQKYLLVVKDDDTIEQRPITPGKLFGGLRAIVAGITAEDRIVINGLMAVRPGAKVVSHEGTIAPGQGATGGFQPETPSTQGTPESLVPRTAPETAPGITGRGAGIAPAPISAPSANVP